MAKRYSKKLDVKNVERLLAYREKHEKDCPAINQDFFDSTDFELEMVEACEKLRKESE